jgi:DNA helicase HerA-like ATPase
VTHPAGNVDHMEAALSAHLADFRTLRRDLEANVLALATSVDGRRFEFQAPLDELELSVGGYAALGDGRLGQVTALEAAWTDAGELGWGGETTMSTRVSIRLARGAGELLGGAGAPFHNEPLRPAAADDVVAWLRTTAPHRAVLPVGELLLARGLVHALDAGGFGRHTFLCGQSGSGKTYALGVLLERLLLETSLRVVVLDPNSDYVRLHELREGVGPEPGDRYAAVAGGIAVHRGETLRLRFPELDVAGRAAALRLDPIRDRDEYAELDAALARVGPGESMVGFDALGETALGRRARNLGADRWGVWARGAASSLDALEDERVRCAVFDLGSLPTREEQALVAQAVLGRLWELRTRREPVLIVIDEAHNVCPADPADPLTRLATEHAVRIAAEGRKFGLYLLTATQRPQKVHPNVVSQSDNLVLMRMNSAADLGYLREVFSFIPPSLLARATTFGLGEALVAGKLSSHPALLKMGPRIAREGGADVPATWASQR